MHAIIAYSHSLKARANIRLPVRVPTKTSTEWCLGESLHTQELHSTKWIREHQRKRPKRVTGIRWKKKKVAVGIIEVDKQAKHARSRDQVAKGVGNNVKIVVVNRKMMHVLPFLNSYFISRGCSVSVAVAVLSIWIYRYPDFPGRIYC